LYCIALYSTGNTIEKKRKEKKRKEKKRKEKKRKEKNVL